MNHLENEASNRMIDALINYETVKFFNNEKAEVKRYSDVVEQFSEMSLKLGSSLAILNIGQNAIFTVGLTSLMLLAAQGVAQGTMTVGDMVMVNGLMFQLSFPLNFVGMIYREIKQAFVDMEGMLKLRTIPSSIVEVDNAPALDVNRGEIEFRNVHFAYSVAKDHQTHDIFKGLNFKVPAGKTVAFVGSSGSGKSTLLRLMYRFYDPNSGDIYIDGQNVKNVAVSSLRAAIGVVPQDIVLFNDTIYYNIAYGNFSASREEIIAACKTAQIYDAIMAMQHGFDTKVGERGLKLSGGEKQRIAIARMILKNPRIVLCDEATSSLDSETEADILASLKVFFV